VLVVLTISYILLIIYGRVSRFRGDLVSLLGTVKKNKNKKKSKKKSKKNQKNKKIKKTIPIRKKMPPDDLLCGT